MQGSKYESEIVITSDEIKQILDRYRIGKKPLAKLLGWGETTIIRYMEGDVPTNEYSNKLKVLLSDPEYYYELLLRRKDCLTGVAFKKSKRAVLTKIMSSKIYAIAYYIVNKSNAELSPAYIQYLLYYAQAFSLAFYDKEIIQEDYIINQEQVPYIRIYQGMKRTGVHTLELTDEYLSKEDKQLVDAVYENFSWYGLKALAGLHSIEKSSMKVSRDINNTKMISKDTIRTYFKDVLEQYQIKDLSEIGNYPENKIQDIKDMKLMVF